MFLDVVPWCYSDFRIYFMKTIYVFTKFDPNCEISQLCSKVQGMVMGPMKPFHVEKFHVGRRELPRLQ